MYDRENRNVSFLFVWKSCSCLECFLTQVRNRYKGSICAKCKGKVYFRCLKTKYVRAVSVGIDMVLLQYSNVKKLRCV